MFQPKYTITNGLLDNIKRINSLVNELNNRRFPHVVLVELERTARAVSSYASTSIEGNPLPLTEVKKILKSKPAHIRDSEKEVLNYNKELQNLNEKLEKMREKPVVVNDPRTRKVIYLPPDTKDVSKLMEDLIGFVNSNRDKIDLLILAGIFHKRMVIIHPFMDGNGRTTRLATKVLLAEIGLNTFNLFSFENYYNKNVTRYFQSVGEFGNYYELANKIDFTPWLEYFTEGIIDELLRAQKLFPDVGFNPQTQLKEYHLKILKFIKAKGFIADRDYAKLVDRAKATRALDFKKLIELGLISRKGKGKATYYVLREK